MATLAPQLTPRTLRKISGAESRRVGFSALMASLTNVGQLGVERVALPRGAATFHIARPRDLERLLDVAESDPEQNLPYWAEVWPSGVALATAITERSDALRGLRVLELGCGLGLTAIAALRAGATVLATDYSSEALALCRLNCRREAGSEPDTLPINWRRDNPLGAISSRTKYPLVLAADVLYERRDVQPLLALTRSVVAPGGELWLAEPGREHAARFLEVLRASGWTGEREQFTGPWPDPEDARKGVVVTVHFLHRPPE
jgi:predicted nicotinamide N-methyase